MNILGDVLRQLDDQSELIKDVVEIHTKRLTISIRYCYLMAERETAVLVAAAVRWRSLLLQLTTILRGFFNSLVRARSLTTSTIRSHC